MPEDQSVVSALGQFFAMLAFTGFLVVVAFEFLRKCRLESQKANRDGLFAFYSVSLPATYYVAIVLSAHSSVASVLFIYIVWAMAIGLMGVSVVGRLPSKETFGFTFCFALSGLLIFAIASSGWSYAYGVFVMPDHLDLTPYLAFIGGVGVWGLVLASVNPIEKVVPHV